MPLVTPLLAGPLTEWSDSLLVLGALPGATVVARSIGSNPRDIANAPAAGGRDRLHLLPGERLFDDDRILVMQVLGGEHSEWTAQVLAVAVGKAPSNHQSLARLAIKSRAWECAARVWITGAVPGAQVVVTGPGGVLATGRATEGGDARLLLATPLSGPPQSIEVYQEAPGGFLPLAGAPTTAVRQMETLPIGRGQRLSPPALGGPPPPAGCDVSVPVAGVYDGAQITILRRSDGSAETSTFDLDRLNFILATPLPNGGDTLEITQAMPDCGERRPSEPLLVDVGPADPPGTPVLRPPCANSSDVLVSNLQPGAVVTVTYGGEEYRGMVPPSDSAQVVRAVPFAATETITAQQQRCGMISGIGSVTVPGVSLMHGLSPDLVEPLVGCARVVRASALPGAWLQVWAAVDGGITPISNQVLATSDSVRIRVAPYLHEGQELWLSYLLCGGAAWAEGPHHRVGQTPEVSLANIATPLIEGDTSVSVDAIPGAAVEVYALTGWPIQVQHVGSGFVDPLVNSVSLTRPLTQRDLVYAEQWMCSQRPGVGAARNVLPATRRFSLAKPLSRLSHRNDDPKPLVCQSAFITLRHKTAWEFTAFLENQEDHAECSFDLQFSLVGVSSPFDAVVKGDLSAKDATTGIALWGIPSSNTFPRHDHFAGFANPSYWEEVLGANYKFELYVAWDDGGGYPEEPDYEDKDDQKP